MTKRKNNKNMYKTGDLIIVKKRQRGEDKINPFFTNDMTQYIGQIFEIYECSGLTNDVVRIRIQNDDTNYQKVRAYWWRKEWLEPYEKEQIFKIDDKDFEI